MADNGNRCLKVQPKQPQHTVITATTLKLSKNDI